MKAFLVDAEAVGKNGLPAVRLFLKDAATGRAFPAYAFFEPYFLLLPDENITGAQESGTMEKFKKTLLEQQFDSHGKPARITAVADCRKTLSGKEARFLKLSVDQPGHVPDIREQVKGFGKCFEHNIPYHLRYVIDSGLVPSSLLEAEIGDGSVLASARAEQSEDLPALRAVAVDIESFSSFGSIPDPSRDPCIMASLADKDGAVVLAHTHKVQAPFVENLASEKALLERIPEILAQKHADLVCTYNGDAFDLPYLQKRSEILGARFCAGRTARPVRTRRIGMRTKSFLSGRVHFDVYHAISFLNTVGAVRLQRLTLDSAYFELFGKHKIDLPYEQLYANWRTGRDLEKVAEYCRVDAVACLELANYCIGLELALSRLVGMPLFESSRATAGQLVEFFLMRKSHHYGEVIPNKPSYSEVVARTANPLKGAFVKTPEPGVYENIAVLDFRSLYPSIIVSHNIDPATIDCECCQDVEMKRAVGHHFCRKRKGLIPRVLEEVLESRFEVKKRLKQAKKDGGEASELFAQLNATQWAMKVVANSIGPNEPLVLRDESGLVRIMSASEFVDPVIGPDSPAVGGTKIGRRLGWSAACFVGARTLFKPVKAVMRHLLHGPLFEVRLRSGRVVRLTKDHSAFTLNGEGEVVPVKGSDLSPGSLLVVPKRLPAGGETEVVLRIVPALSSAPKEDLEGIVITAKLPFPKDVSLNFARILEALDEPAFPNAVRFKLGLQHRTASRLLKRLEGLGMVLSARKANGRVYRRTGKGSDFARFILGVVGKMKYNGNRREHFALLANVRDAVSALPPHLFDGFKVGALNGRRIGNKLVVDARTAAFLGYYVSEGHARKWKNKTGGMSYRLALTNHDEEILSEMYGLAAGFGLPVRKERRNVGLNQHIAFLLSKHVFQAGCNAYEKQVPPVILSSPSHVQREFLRAYFNGDGNYERRAKRTRFTTVSEKLATSLVVLLNQLGFGAVSVKRDGKFFRVVVSEDIFENTGRKRFGKFSRLVPARFLEKEIRALKKSRYRAALKNNISRQQLEKFYSEYLPVFGRSERIESLLDFLGSDLAVDAVERVTTVKEPPKWVYDLSVEDAENFIGGFGGVCLHNSFYGYLAYPRSRWYDHECGEATTGLGRQYIQDTMHKAESEGFKVLYGDTDSLLLQFEKGGENKVTEFQSKINSSLPGNMELELEDIYPRGVFVSKKAAGKDDKNAEGAKKKYALINREGKIKIRGFELVRRDWSPVAKKTQRKLLQILLETGDVKAAVAMARAVVEELKAGKTPMDDLVILTQLRKKTGAYAVTSPELAAAQKARKAGMKIPENSLIGYVITRSGRTISEKATVREHAADYDPDYYINNQVIPAVLKLLGAFGYDAEELKASGRQSRLDGW